MAPLYACAVPVLPQGTHIVYVEASSEEEARSEALRKAFESNDMSWTGVIEVREVDADDLEKL